MAENNQWVNYCGFRRGSTRMVHFLSVPECSTFSALAHPRTKAHAPAPSVASPWGGMINSPLPNHPKSHFHNGMNAIISPPRRS